LEFADRIVSIEDGTIASPLEHQMLPAGVFENAAQLSAGSIS